MKQTEYKYHQIANGKRVVIENPKSYFEWIESDYWVEIKQ